MRERFWSFVSSDRATMTVIGLLCAALAVLIFVAGTAA